MLLNVITCIICIGSIFVYRQLDKNNKSLVKLKRFADKIQEDLDAYYKEKAVQLAEAGNALDVQQSKAVAASMKLERLREEFEQKSSFIEDKLELLDVISSRLQAFEISVKKLFESSKHIQEGMMRIQSDGQIVESYDKRLLEYTKSTDELIALLQNTEERIIQENEERLREHTENLLTDLRYDLATVESNATGIFERTNALFSQITESLEESLTKAAEKAEALEGTAFDSLRTKALERLEKYHQVIEDKNKDLQNLLREKIQETGQLAKNFKTSWESEAQLLMGDVSEQIERSRKLIQTNRDEVQNSLQEFTSETNKKIQDIALELQKIYGIVDEKNNQIQQLVSENQQKMSLSSETIQNSLQVLSSKIDSEVASLENRFDSNLVELSEKIDNHVGDITRQLEEEKHAVDSQITDFTTEMNSKVHLNMQGIQDNLNAVIDEYQSSSNIRIQELKAFFDNNSNIDHQKIDEKLSEVKKYFDEHIETINESIKNKILGFESDYSVIIKKIETQSSEQITEFLSKYDTDIDSYKKELAYRCQRLEDTLPDVDALEAALRQAMNEVNLKVTSDFNQFIKNQQTIQNQFADSIKENEQSISAQVRLLEDDLAGLKEKAYENVSQNLKVFEDEFFVDLNKRSEDIQQNLNQWKASFEDQLKGIQGNLAASYERIETDYSDELKNRLEDIQLKYQESLSNLEKSIAFAESTFKEKIGSFDLNYQNVLSAHNAEFEKLKETTDTFVRQEMENFKEDYKEQLERSKKEVSSSLDAYRDELSESQEKSTKVIHGILGDFTAWQERVAAQLDESKNLFAMKLNDLQQNSDQKITEIHSAIENEIQEMISKTSATRKELSDGLQNFRNETNEVFASYDVRSKELANNLYDIKEQNEEIRKSFVDKIQADTDVLTGTIQDLDVRLQDFVAKSALIEEAEVYKDELEASVEAIKKEILNLDVYKQNLANLSEGMNKIMELETEVSQKAKNFFLEKERIERLESDFARLLELSNSMEQKIFSMQDASDDIQTLQVEVRKFQDRVGDIAQRYERLDKKSDTLDHTLEGIDTAFDKLKTIEQQVQLFASQVEDMPVRIGALRADMDVLLRESPKVNQVLENIQTITKELSTTEVKMDNLKNSQEWLAATETRLQRLAKDCDNQIRLLGELVKNSRETNSAQEGAPSLAKRENVLALARSGWKDTEIATRLNISLSEVQLILDYHGGEK